MAATLGAAIQGLIANIEQHTSGGASYATAADDLLQLRGMLAAWEHFRAQRQKECVEAFGGAVQHDAPTLNPSADLPFTRYLAQALLESEKDPSVDATAVAAGLAFFCLSNPRALKLSAAAAGRKLDSLADKHPDAWYLSYAKATWRQLREDRQAALKALTKGIQAPGAPCGLHYTRARVLSYLKKFEMAAADYKRYLELAPPDHRSIPDAHYALALDLFTKGGPSTDLEEARRQYELGQAAEASVAPWVGYQPSEAKMFAGMMLQAPAFRGR